MKQNQRAVSKSANSKSPPEKVKLRRLPTGVGGLDEILGGGLPEFSFNIIAGAPGTGKTTLAHQIIFANATPQSPALYFTVLGEPTIKMLRYQQQYSFFDQAKLHQSIRFLNLTDVIMAHDLGCVLNKITQEVQAVHPGVVVVDSFRNVLGKPLSGHSDMEVQGFVQRLALFLTSWQATTFLIGEYSEMEFHESPVFTVADGLFWLTQNVERNSVVRKLQIIKSRGGESVPGLHTIRITNDGLQAFSRTFGLLGSPRPRAKRRLLSIGIPELDQMMGGGILEGDSMLVAGPSGTGKSALATQFLAAGLRNGEPAVAAIFEERPQGYMARADAFGLELNQAQKKGKFLMVYLRPLDLSVGEMMRAVLDAVKRINAKRLVIDSLVGFEMALAPGFREDFRESLYRMIAALTGAGVTIVTTVETEDNFSSMQFSRYAISFLTDDIIRLRYVEIDGQLRKLMVVIKMRGGNHSKDIREYVIADKGVVVIGPRQTEYARLTTGLPERVGSVREVAPEPKARSSDRNGGPAIQGK
jgi:circadian clock protein KaiC